MFVSIYVFSEIIEETSMKTMLFIIDIWHQIVLNKPDFKQVQISGDSSLGNILNSRNSLERLLLS